MVYMRKEQWTFLWGTLALIGGNAGSFVVPLYIGWFTDDISKGDFDHIWTLCWQLMLIIVVCIFQFKLILYRLHQSVCL